MNKKVIIGIMVAVVLGISVGLVVFFMISQPKANPEEIWKTYISLINEKKYEEMYGMITEEAKSQISQEDFIKRNQNINEGIEVCKMKIEITAEEEEDSSTRKISYNSSMDTEAGEIDFTNTARLTKDKEKGYLINWSSSLIFPQLNNTDKVRIKTISAKRGSIIDKNGTLLAGEGEISSVGIVPGKFGENKEQEIEQIANLLGTTADAINKTLSASWVKADTFVPIKEISKGATDLKTELLKNPSIKITTAKSRVYPLGEAAAHLVGYVQNITAEELEANVGKGYTSNSVIGKAGLEKIYEERLKGKDGVEIYILDAEGNRKTDIAKIDVQNGETIKLTIDSNIQTKLYNDIKENEGFFVVMHPQTGALMALVSTPSYDPNDFILGMSNEKWNSIKNDNRNPMLTRY